MELLLSLGIVLCAMVIFILFFRNSQLYHRVEGLKQLNRETIRQSGNHDKALHPTRPPSYFHFIDERNLYEIATAESDGANAELWHFAYVNSDLMPEWELYNVGVAESPIHVRNSAWATFCANLTVMSRECLEQTMAEVRREVS